MIRPGKWCGRRSPLISGIVYDLSNPFFTPVFCNPLFGGPGYYQLGTCKRVLIKRELQTTAHIHCLIKPSWALFRPRAANNVGKVQILEMQDSGLNSPLEPQILTDYFLHCQEPQNTNLYIKHAHLFKEAMRTCID